MLDNKDYAQLTLEELLAEEKKVKQKELYSAVIIGLLIGVMLYGIVKNGFGLKTYIFASVFLIFAIYRNSQNVKQNLRQIRTEINAKSSKLDVGESHMSTEKIK